MEGKYNVIFKELIRLQSGGEELGPQSFEVESAELEEIRELREIVEELTETEIPPTVFTTT